MEGPCQPSTNANGTLQASHCAWITCTRFRLVYLLCGTAMFAMTRPEHCKAMDGFAACMHLPSKSAPQMLQMVSISGKKLFTC